MNLRICTVSAIGAVLALSLSVSGQTSFPRGQHAASRQSILAEANQPSAQVSFQLENSGAGIFHGQNSPQQLTLEFNSQEARLKHSTSTAGLRLTAYGYGQKLRAPLEASLAANGNRMEYRRGELTEWYVNQADGLEQGFTFAQRPGAKNGEPLVIALTVTGSLQPLLSADGRKVLLQSEGRDVFSYSGLRSWDAQRRAVASRLEVHDREIRLVVDDRDAEYPLVVDPITATTFQPAPGSPDAVGVNPEAVVVGDFDKSGSQDLAVANLGGFVSILLGQNDGTFLPHASLAGRAPRAIAMGDFNGDTWPDLVVVNSIAGISVLLNNKNIPSPGTFQVPTSYPAGATPEAVAVGKLNSDANLDLVVANNGDNTVSVFLGNGNGTFQPAVPYPVGTGPSAVAIGKFIEADANLGLAVVNSGDGTVSILKGSPAGSFTLFATIVLGQFGRTLNGSQMIIVDDFNNDGHKDLAIAGDLGVVVLLGNGDGTFAPPAVYPAHVLPSGIASGDFNGDTIPDLAVTNAFSNDLSVLIGNGDGTFKPPVNFPTGTFPTSVAVGDFNNDTRVDVAITNFGDNNVSVLLGTLWNINVFSGTPQATNTNKPFPLPLVARVTDSLNAPVPGAVVTFAAPDPIAGPSATLVPAGPQFTDVGGFVQVNATANGLAGSYSVNALLGFAGVATYSLRNNPGDPTVSANGGTPQTANLNTAFASPLIAKVIDELGNGVPSIPVTFTAPSSGAGGTFAGGATIAIVNTNSSGLAASPVFTANGTSGSYNVTAASTVPGVVGVGIFKLTNAGPPPAPPAKIVAAGGTPQSVGVNGQFAALLAKVTDAVGNPVPGVSVKFTINPVGGAGAAFPGGVASATAQTDGSGVATSPAPVANPTSGAYSVSASVPAFAAITPALFSLTNLPATLVPATVTIKAGDTAQIPLTLPSPAAGAMFITITSSASSIVTVTTPSILIPAGSTTGRSAIRVSALKVGTATLTACQSLNGIDCTATFGIAPMITQINVVP